MAEHLYTTNAFIFGSSPVGEANRMLDLFTEGQGRVRALARSVRRERSKLRFHLQPLSFATVTLLRGREIWRIAGALRHETMPALHALSGEARVVAGNALRLVRRLLQGEEAHPELFLQLVDAFTFLHTAELTREEYHNIECVLVLRILHALGYLADEGDVAPYLAPSPLSAELARRAAPIRRAAIMKINESLAASSL